MMPLIHWLDLSSHSLIKSEKTWRDTSAYVCYMLYHNTFFFSLTFCKSYLLSFRTFQTKLPRHCLKPPRTMIIATDQFILFRRVWSVVRQISWNGMWYEIWDFHLWVLVLLSLPSYFQTYPWASFCLQTNHVWCVCHWPTESHHHS